MRSVPHQIRRRSLSPLNFFEHSFQTNLPHTWLLSLRLGIIIAIVVAGIGGLAGIIFGDVVVVVVEIAGLTDSGVWWRSTKRCNVVKIGSDMQQGEFGHAMLLWFWFYLRAG